MKHFLFLLIATFLTLTFTKAQPFEIRAVNKGFGIIGVELRKVTSAPPTTQNYITDIVFGLKWRVAASVDLLNVTTTTYNIKKSSVRKTKDGFYYQAFYADQTPYFVPADWTLNQWVEIMTIVNTQSGIGTGTFLICEKNFDVTTDPNLGIDLTDYEPAIRDSATNVILPVKLLNFDVSSQKASIKAEWKTNNETNNKGFFLQRSQGNAMAFTNAAWINAKQNSTANSYDYIDKNVQFDLDYYYRLQQVDKDGAISYSPVRQARLDKKYAFVLAPNPVKENLVLTLPEGSSINEKYAFRITDSKGVVIYQKEEVIRSRNYTVTVAWLAAGNYFFTCEKESKELFTQNFIKL